MTHETDHRGGRLPLVARRLGVNGMPSTEYRDGRLGDATMLATPEREGAHRGGVRAPRPADALPRAPDGRRRPGTGSCDADLAATGGNGGNGGNTRAGPPLAARCRHRADRGNTGNGRKPRRIAPVDFAAVNGAALPHLEALCCRWLPGGRRIGREWVCGSLRGEAGASCKVNLRTGRWADFDTGEKGGDPVSFAAAVHRLSQADAGRRLAAMLGLEVEGQRHG